MRLRAWQLCWLLLDAASSPANNLPDTLDAQALRPDLVAQLSARRSLPKFNTQIWQELRRARDQQLFAALPARQPLTADSIANEALATTLAAAFARVGLEQLRAWATPSVTAAVAHWLSACMLALDALALSDDDSDAAALELAVFVQGTLQREHGAVFTLDEPVHAEPEAGPISDQSAAEAVRAREPAPEVEPPPAVGAPPPRPAAAAAAPQASATPSSVSTTHEAPKRAAQAAPQSPRPRPRAALALVGGGLACAAALLWMLNTGDVSSPAESPPVGIVKPLVRTPDPAAPVAAPEPEVAEQPVADDVPVAKPAVAAPASSPQPAAAPRRPRFRNVAAAKRAHAAKKIDDAALTAALAELEAVRTARIAKEQLELSRGKLSQREFQRRVNAINKRLGFESR